jgi:hypothetical protein
MEQPTVADMMAAYAEDAVEIARNQFGIDLDYSEASVQRIEGILETLYRQRPSGVIARLFRRGPSEEILHQHCNGWGGYIGEVMRRHWNGEWRDHSEIAPGFIVTLRVGEADIYPPAKVRKRLTNGSEDDVWFYYQVLRQEHGNQAD